MEKKALLTAIRAAIGAGKVIMDVYNDPKADFQIERKADNSPLTIADRKADAYIREALSSTPYPLLSEEGRSTAFEERRKWRELWIVDPLDGTKEFIKRNGEFTVNIAYVRDGSPEAGVIYIPVTEELYFADIDEGAFKAAHVEAADSWDDLVAKADRLPFGGGHEGFVVVASRSHMNADTEAYIEKVKKEKGNVTTVSKGSSLKLCLIAEGNADVYPRYAPTMEWDIAAGNAIVKAAGRGVYSMDDGKPLVYNKENLVNPWFISQ